MEYRSILFKRRQIELKFLRKDDNDEHKEQSYNDKHHKKGTP